MTKLTDVMTALDMLKQLVPGLPPLKVSPEFHIPGSWKESSYPNSENPGVYFFVDAQGDVLYVGKTSGSTMGLGKRIGAYIGREGVIKDAKVEGAAVLHTIPLEWKFRFLAAAVEEFLIEQLDPPVNKTGHG